MKGKIITTLVIILMGFQNYSVAQLWTLMQNIPGDTNDYHGALAFQINGKIYAGAGNYSKSLFEYDTTANTWTYKDSIPGSTYSRHGAVAFALNDKGYIAFGQDINPVTHSYAMLTDIWEYDPVGNTWTQRPSFPDHYRYGAATFVINNKAYITGGSDSNGVFTNDTWEFDGANWSQKLDMPVTDLSHSSTFVLNGKGYVVGGYSDNGGNGYYRKILLEYDASADSLVLVSTIWDITD